MEEFKIDLEGGAFAGMDSSIPEVPFPRIVGYGDECDGGCERNSHVPHAPSQHAGAARDMWALPESEYMLGVNGHGEPETFSLTADSPHMFVSAESGAGKSVIAASIATQALVKGASVAFLDVKLISHRWAKSLPGVTYAAEIHDIGSVLISVLAELKRRMRVIDEFPGPASEAPVGPRILLIAEEINSMMNELVEFEKGLPPRGVYKPTKAFRDILNLGRAAKINVVAFAQYPDAKLIPRPVIEAFGTRVLIKHKAPAWNALCFNLGYSPPAPQALGRGLTVKGDRVTETQFLYLSEEQCAALVRELRPEAERVGVRGAVREARRALAQRRELRELEGR